MSGKYYWPDVFCLYIAVKTPPCFNQSDSSSKASKILQHYSTKDNTRSYLVLGAVFFTDFFTFGSIKSLGVIIPVLKLQLSLPTWLLGSSVAFMVACGFKLGLTTQLLVKQVGPRGAVISCGVMSNIGFLICAVSSNEYHLLIGLFFAGFSFIQENIMLGIVPEYFHRHYNTAVSVYLSATALGITIMPLVTQWLLSVYGWRGTLVLISGIGMHSIPLSGSTEVSAEGTKLLNGSKYSQVNNDRNRIDQGCLSPAFNVLKRPFINASFLLIFLLPGFAYGYVFNGWMIYIVSYATDIDMNIHESSIIASCGGLGFFLIRLFFPLAKKLLTSRNIIHISSLIASVCLIGTVMSVQFQLLCLVSLGFGVAIGFLGGKLYTISKDFAGGDDYFTVLALFHVANGIGVISSGILTGAVYDITRSFIASFIVLASMALLTPISLGLNHLLEVVQTRD